MAKSESTPAAADSPLVALTQAQLSDLLAMATAQQNPSAQLTDLVGAIKAQAEAQNRISEEVARTSRKFNADHEHINVFTFDAKCDYCVAKKRHPPELGGLMGHPEEPCKFAEVYFPASARLWPDQMTNAEIKLINRFTTSRECRNGAIKAVVSPDGRKLQIHANVYSLSDRAELGPLTLVLGELLFGPEVADPSNAMAEIAKLRAELDSMKAAAVPA